MDRQRETKRKKRCKKIDREIQKVKKSQTDRQGQADGLDSSRQWEKEGKKETE